MPGPNPPELANEEMKSLLVEVWPFIPAAVRKACRSLGRHPHQIELDGLVQRIVLLLMDNDFHTLRSFDNHSKPQTWLYKIAWRHILHLLEEQKRKSSLEDLPPDSLISPPNQEEKLLLEENVNAIGFDFGRGRQFGVGDHFRARLDQFAAAGRTSSFLDRYVFKRAAVFFFRRRGAIAKTALPGFAAGTFGFFLCLFFEKGEAEQAFFRFSSSFSARNRVISAINCRISSSSCSWLNCAGSRLRFMTAGNLKSTGDFGKAEPLINY